MDDTTLIRAANGARISEAVANYGRVEVGGVPRRTRAKPARHTHLSDQNFWYLVFNDEHPVRDVRIPKPLLLSEWVARVPGLYWTNSAKFLRKKGEQKVESRGRRGGITLRPFGKSEIVSGGVGTLKLPPSDDGDHLVTITSTANASAGVPALISAEVWEAHDLREGVAICARSAAWRPMSTTWAAQFPSTRGIPRAYLRIDDPAAVEVEQTNAATQIHPFSIMRYDNGAAELFDFVFCTGYSTDPAFRNEVEDFFTTYCRAEGRHGEYLIDADLTRPMWESRYHSPAELRDAEALLQRRIEDAMFGDDLTERLLGLLTQLTAGELQHLSESIDVPHTRWSRGSYQAQEVQKFLLKVPREKTASLVDAIRTIHPELVVN